MTFYGDKARAAKPVSQRDFWIFHGGLILFAVVALVVLGL
jgi:hypothetical protein